MERASNSAFLSSLIKSFILLILLGAAGPATPREFEVVWSLDAPATAGTITLEEKTTQTLKSRLLPQRLIVLDEDAVSSRRGLIMVGDSELAVANIDASGTAACIINPWATLNRTGRSARANQINTCLVDEDGDHKFDHFFAYNSFRIPVGARGAVRGYEPINGAGYHETDAATSRDARDVELRVTRWTDRTQLQLCLPNAGGYKLGCFDPSVSVADDQAPKQFEFAGGMFEVSKPSNGSVQFRQLAGVGPLHIKKSPIR